MDVFGRFKDVVRHAIDSEVCSEIVFDSLLQTKTYSSLLASLATHENFVTMHFTPGSTTLVQILFMSLLVKSKSQAYKRLKEGSIYVNRRAEQVDRLVTFTDLCVNEAGDCGILLVGSGKKTYRVVHLVSTK